MTSTSVNEKELESVVELISKSLDMNQIFEYVMSYLAERYKTELDDVEDVSLKQHIIEQRLPAALEECGVMKLAHEVFSELGIPSRLESLEQERTHLQENIAKLKSDIDSLVSEMKELQLNHFGRVIHPFDNRVIDLARDEDDLEVIEIPNELDKKEAAMRLVQPSELLIGLSLAIDQPVLCHKGSDSWFPGRVSAILARSTPGTQNFPMYKITLDAAPGAKTEQCNAALSSLALASSAAELRQKYPVGARVVSIYRDDTGGIGYYSGLIAEPPSERNNNRYLLFFDDGYTQYSPPTETYRICYQSKENWREASEGSREFIKRYLAQYPQRPMVRLKPGQTIETEYEGEWIQAVVDKVDASLILVRFSPTHSEWIYRGSTRLEPLYNDLNASAGYIGRERNERLEVEYGNVDPSLTDKSPGSKLRKARKSATGNRDNARKAGRSIVTRSSARRAPNLRSSSSGRLDMMELESAGSVVPYLDNLISGVTVKPYASHKCTPFCLVYRKGSDLPAVSEDPFTYKGLNPLEIPLRAGWLRFLLIGQPNDYGRQLIVYNAPCGRQLRSMHEVQKFLDRTNSKLTTDLFSFDPDLTINSEFRAEKTLTNIADISYGKENVPVPCVNSVDNEVPGYIDYIAQRQPMGSVPMHDDNFVVCCDCTDNCRDRTKCACQQLTAEASSLTNPNGMVDFQAGYRYRRLSQFTVGGIYECNRKCRCDRRCSNRVVQQGLWVRLQVFKTSRKGWGIRALNAIPKGTFICTYAGAVYDESMAVQEGFDYGDEYQAELDYIETVEKPKECFESEPEDPEFATVQTQSLPLQPASNSESQSAPQLSSHRLLVSRAINAESDSSSFSESSDSGDHISRSSEVSSNSPNRNPSVDHYNRSHNTNKAGLSDCVEQSSHTTLTPHPSDNRLRMLDSPELRRTNDKDSSPNVNVVSEKCAPEISQGEQKLNSSMDTSEPICVDEKEDAKENKQTGLSSSSVDHDVAMATPPKSEYCGNLFNENDMKKSISAKDSRLAMKSQSKKNYVTIKTYADPEHEPQESSLVSEEARISMASPPESKTKAEENRLPSPRSPTLPERIGKRIKDKYTRMSRSRLRARALSLPEEYLSLKGVRKVLKEADFGRIPLVDLVRLGSPTDTASSPPRRSISESPVRTTEDRKKVKVQLLAGPRCPTSSHTFKKEAIWQKLKTTKWSHVSHGPLKLRLRRATTESPIRSSRRSSKSSSVDTTNSKPSARPTKVVATEKTQLQRRSSRSTSKKSSMSGALFEDNNSQDKTRAHHRHHHRHNQQQQLRRFYPVAQPHWLPARIYFKDDNPYIMDAKKMGNLGRYFNHSCNPNVFVQNVFIDSHDPRLPEVAFFTKRNIAVGEEMTWDYGYTVDAVPFKVLYCYCGEPNCRIRLL